LFCYFEDGVSGIICLGWSWVMISPILASQVLRIIGVSLFWGGMVLGFELRALHLIGRHCTTWTTPPAPQYSFLKIILKISYFIECPSIWACLLWHYKKFMVVRYWWVMPVILATWNVGCFSRHHIRRNLMSPIIIAWWCLLPSL
jgi:hypothetical protein